MRTLFEDLRFGFRVLRNRPGFTVVAVLTLAVGIAANTTVFSWIDGVLLGPLPGVANVQTLAPLEATMPDGEFITTSPVEYRYFRDNLKLLSGLAAAHQDAFTIGDANNGQRIWGELVSGNYFELLGVKPALGRVFSRQEYGDAPGAYPLVVISYRLWRGRFHGDPRVIGTTIRLNRRELTVIGVAPPEFCGTVNGLVFDFWAPVTMAKELSIWNDAAFRYRGSRGLNSIARLKPGVTIEQARAELASLVRQLDAISPEAARGYGATLSPVWKAHYGAGAILLKPLEILMAVSLVMLLIACVNVANLLLASAASRQKEFAIRVALGARRGRVARQLLTESLLLAGGGAFAALLLTPWMQSALLWLIPRTGLPVAIGAGFNARVYGFTLLAAGLAAVLAGTAPAIFSMRADVNEDLKQGGRSGHSGRHSHRTRSALVIAEVALAALALIGAGLFVRSFGNASALRLGFDPDRVLLTQFYPASASYNEPQTQAFCRRLRDRLAATPGVESVAYADSAPLGFGGSPFQTLTVEGYAPAQSEDLKIHRTLVSPGYFGLLRIPFLDGRDFTGREDRSTPRVMIVNVSFARRFFYGRNPLGRKVQVEGRWFTVVGMVKDSKHQQPAEPPTPFFYVPFEQYFNTGLSVHFFIRTPADPNLALGAVRREVAGVDPNIGAFLAVPLPEYITTALYPQKVAASLLAVLAAISLLLAAVGLYSVLSYSVNQRRQEIGVRMAMGAQPGSVLGLVVRQGMLLTAVGLVAGMAAALATAPLVGGMLVNVGANDPATFAAAAVFLAAIALLATYLPARRATRLDPMSALRCE